MVVKMEETPKWEPRGSRDLGEDRTKAWPPTLPHTGNSFNVVTPCHHRPPEAVGPIHSVLILSLTYLMNTDGPALLVFQSTQTLEGHLEITRPPSLDLYAN